MANLEVKGIVCSMSALESGVSRSEREWKKKTVVVQEEGQYGKKVAITLMGDKADDTFKKDQEVTIQCNVESQEYNGRWFTNINAWKIEKETASYSPAPATKTATSAPTAYDTSSNDNLPF